MILIGWSYNSSCQVHFLVEETGGFEAKVLFNDRSLIVPHPDWLFLALKKRKK